MKKLLFCIPVLFILFSCNHAKKEATLFVTVKDGKFHIGKEPYSYVGTNFWYGAILGSEGVGGNRERLIKELDFMKSIGINNLRILVGADGPDGIPTKVEPALQKEPGVYNDTIFDGLDYLLSEMGKRSMYAVLYLNNSWEWSGGYSQYLQWAGAGKAPIPAIDGWSAFMEYVQQYAVNKDAQNIFYQYVKDVITRTNRYTGLKYADDPYIMSWQIGNEPRAFSESNKQPYAGWIGEIAALINELDPNHLVSIGSEGKSGTEGDIGLYEQIHADSNIDYMTIHIWPYNWGWITKETIKENLPVAITNTMGYIDEHLQIAERHRKPVVMEEFGFPRDGFRFDKASSTTCRDQYYEAVFAYIKENMQKGGQFAGCNFWAWGGFAELSSDHVFWQRGDDYTGDPAQEEQGLNSVFASDKSTIEVIRKYSKLLKSK